MAYPPRPPRRSSPLVDPFAQAEGGQQYRTISGSSSPPVSPKTMASKLAPSPTSSRANTMEDDHEHLDNPRTGPLESHFMDHERPVLPCVDTRDALGHKDSTAHSVDLLSTTKPAELPTSYIKLDSPLHSSPSILPPYPSPASIYSLGSTPPTSFPFGQSFSRDPQVPRRGSASTFGGQRSRGSVVQLTSIVDDMTIQVPENSPAPTREFSRSIGSVSGPSTHSEPDSSEAIMKHLMDAHDRNEQRIIPAEALVAPGMMRSLSSGSQLRSKKPPPSSGTPLAGGVEEGHDEEGLLVAPHSRYWANRHTGIFDLDMDHVEMVTNLRDRSLSEAERVLVGLCEPIDPALSTEIAPNSSLDITDDPASQMYRADSQDSAQTSASAARLLPARPPFVLQPPPPRFPPSLANKVELRADQKAMLVKRSRKLEKVLGEPLPEPTIERYVVEPTMVQTTVSTKVEQVWPRTPTHESPPEWMREDCAPRRASIGENPVVATKPPPATRSRFARAILGDPAQPIPAGLEVYVSRERHTAETREGELFTRMQHRSSLMPPSSSPHASASDSTPSSPSVPEDEVWRRGRRAQLSKLQRLLGGPISPGMLASPKPHNEELPAQAYPPLSRAMSNSSAITERTPEKWSARFRKPKLDNTASRPASIAPSMPSAPASPTVDEIPTERMSTAQRRLARKRATKLSKLFGEAPPPNLYVPRSETSIPSPPDTIGHSSASHTRVNSQSNDGSGSPVFQAYRHSLKNILYLVEHDQGRLAHIVDELDATDKCHVHATSAGNTPHKTLPSSPTAESPSSNYSRPSLGSRRASAPPASLTFTPPDDSTPVLRSPTTPLSFLGVRGGEPSPSLTKTPDPNSPTVLRWRTSKLANFFGERPVGYTSTPRPNTTHDPNVSQEPTREIPHSDHIRPQQISRHHPILDESPFNDTSPTPVIRQFTPLPPPRPARHRISPSTTPLPEEPKETASLAVTYANAYTESLERRNVSGGSKRTPSLYSASGLPSSAIRRRDTLDGVLDEMWHSVQSEIRDGSMAGMEAAQLGDIMGKIRRRRDSEWAEA